MEASRRAAVFGLFGRRTVSRHPANSASDKITTLAFQPWRVTRSGSRPSVTRSNQVAMFWRGSVKDTWAISTLRFGSHEPRQHFFHVHDAQILLCGTPFAALFDTPLPLTVPQSLRFEHTHILAGSGHGKTQMLQHLILNDLRRPDPPNVVILDSRGHMLSKISHLAIFNDALRGRLIIMDPRDVEHPPALNMFEYRQPVSNFWARPHIT
jgi:hypothetical protein